MVTTLKSNHGHASTSLLYSKWRSQQVVTRGRILVAYKLRYIVGFGLIEIDMSINQKHMIYHSLYENMGGGPRVVVSTAAFHVRVRGSVPGLGGLKETKMFLPHPRVKVSIVGSLRDREVACSASDRQGSNFESCVWRTVSSQSSSGGSPGPV